MPIVSQSRVFVYISIASAGVSNTLALAALLILAFLGYGSAYAQTEEGALQLTMVDATTGVVTPARVEIKGADGQYRIAEDALLAGVSLTGIMAWKKRSPSSAGK
jgi:hypothetical protein